jgi:putative membrane protein
MRALRAVGLWVLLLAAGFGSALGSVDIDTVAAKELISKIHQENRQEIMVAEVALERASSGKVRAFAQRALNDHKFFEDRLQRIAKSLGATIPASAGRPQDLVPSEIRHGSGGRFEEFFLRWMREGHQSAIESMRRMVASVRPDSPLGVLVARMIPVLEQHYSLALRLGNEARETG